MASCGASDVMEVASRRVLDQDGKVPVAAATPSHQRSSLETRQPRICAPASWQHPTSTTALGLSVAEV